MDASDRKNDFIVEDLGLIEYQKALSYQLTLVEKISKQEDLNRIIFCSHPPVVTLGKNSQTEDVYGWAGEIVHVSRGGRATYHGPKQLIIYPIINLKRSSCGLDVIQFVRNLEQSLCDTLKNLYNITSVGNDGKDRATGVWIGSKKIASIGVAVKRWTTYHGMAINLYNDPLAFTGINPCGYSSEVMISLQEILNIKAKSESESENGSEIESENGSEIDINKLKKTFLNNLII
ncbi:MAG: lipoyl(octanoyl) transferase LipB [Oligoflexia bacterium]|nr:lipoyl(octanoyl) transferase LipB [Oligoflexia bacterium]